MPLIGARRAILTPPKLVAVNFLTQGVMPPWLTDSRASTADYTAAAGLIAQAPASAPRFDYTGGTANGLLIEEQRTNNALQSADQTQSVWSKGGNTVVVSSKLSPDGTAFMSMQTATATGPGNFVRQSISTAAATVYSISTYFIAGTSTYLNLQISDFTANAAGVFVNTSSLVASTSTAGDGSVIGTPSVVFVGNGIYRAVASVSFANARSTFFNVGGASGTNSNTTSGQTIYIWGSQVEIGAFPTSYIPTTAAAVTRSADILSSPIFKNSPIILETKSIVTGAVARTLYNPGSGLSAVTDCWVRSAGVYRPGTPAGYLNGKLQVGSSY